MENVSIPAGLSGESGESSVQEAQGPREFAGLTPKSAFVILDSMKRLTFLVIVLGAIGNISADTLLPSAVGTTWKYEMTQEFGEGVRPSADEKTTVGPDGKVHLPISIFVAGTEKIDGVETYKYELERQGRVQLTEFLQVNDAGVIAFARADSDGEKAKLTPPQKILSFPPHAEKWEYNGRVDDIETRQSYEILGRESISVPAGKFDAFHLRLTQLAPTPPSVQEDRWFTPNVGYVKILTEVKLAGGGLIQRINLEMTEGPRVGERPSVTSKPEEKKALGAALAKELTGEPTTTFTADIPKIYARWQGETLKKGDKVRAVWMTEDVGEAAPPNYKIAETPNTATGPRSFGTFTLSKPNKGWPVGKYRLELYVGTELVETLRFTISR